VERGIDLQGLLGRLEGETWWLHEEGGHVLGECSGVEGGSMVVVVGDQIGFTSEEERLLEEWQGMKKVRLGSTVSSPPSLLFIRRKSLAKIFAHFCLEQ
jgi:tRNA pseudouridine-54 N-methylase